MTLTDKLLVERVGLEAYLASEYGEKLEQNQIERLDTINSLLGVNSNSAFLFSGTITRGANTTPYTANDVYGAAFELVSGTAPIAGQFILITDIEIIFNIAALPSGMGDLLFYLYNVTPPSAKVDNTGFSIPSGDRAAIINPTGISLSASLAIGGGSVVAQKSNINYVCKLTGTSLFAHLVTLAGFTPAANSETATVRLKGIAI